jgi:hypothetical protein
VGHSVFPTVAGFFLHVLSLYIRNPCNNIYNKSGKVRYVHLTTVALFRNHCCSANATVRFTFLSYNDAIDNITCCTMLLWRICHRQQRNAFRSSCKVPDICVRLQRNVDFPRQIFVEIRNVKFQVNLYSRSRADTDGRT